MQSARLNRADCIMGKNLLAWLSLEAILGAKLGRDLNRKVYGFLFTT
jgi:hypothetical protein